VSERDVNSFIQKPDGRGRERVENRCMQGEEEHGRKKNGIMMARPISEKSSPSAVSQRDRWMCGGTHTHTPTHTHTHTVLSLKFNYTGPSLEHNGAIV